MRLEPRPPAELGMPLEAVDTPALLIDLDPFERNLRRMSAAVAGTGATRGQGPGRSPPRAASIRPGQAALSAA